MNNALTPILASHNDKNGVWVIAAIWPAAATSRLIDVITMGWDTRASDGDVGSYGRSSEGKSNS